MTVPVVSVQIGPVDHESDYTNSITWTLSGGGIVDMTGAAAQAVIASPRATVALAVGSGITIASNVLAFTFTRAQLTSLGLGTFGFTVNVDFASGQSAQLAGGSITIA